MSADTPQDSELKQLLADTAALRRRYRTASQEEPPTQLDEAIRAAARREVRARPYPARSRLPASWRIPASIAAVVVVSVTLTVMVAQHDAQLPVATEQPAPAPALGAGAAKDQAEAASASGALKEKGGRDFAKGVVQARRPAGGAPASPDASTVAPVEKLERSVAPEVKSPIGAAGTDLRAEPSRALAPAKPAPAATPAAAAGANSTPAQSTAQEGTVKAAAEEAVSAQPVARKRAQANFAEADSRSSPWENNPQAWLAHIEELRAAERNEDAAVSFRAFRTRYPDYRLPAGFVAPGP